MEKEGSGTCSPLLLNNSVVASALIGGQNEEQIFFNIQSVSILSSIIRKLQQKGPPKALKPAEFTYITLMPKTWKER